MRWRKLEASGNVSDRRGMRGPVGAGVGGLGLIGVLVLLVSGVFGGGGTAFEDLLAQVQPAQPETQTQPDEFAGMDNDEDFVRRVVGSTETLWDAIYAASDLTYEPAQLVLFTGATSSGCGGATSAIGPHYCPADRTVYLDLEFFDDMQQRFGATAGEFAQAYVIAHEIGHHVQNDLGIMNEVRNAQRADSGRANELSVGMELQADCFAGIWAHSVWQRGDVLEPGDIEDALGAAAAVGDDRIQEAMTGSVNPESWTHGSAAQRVAAFEAGYANGDPAACDAF